MEVSALGNKPVKTFTYLNYQMESRCLVNI